MKLKFIKHESLWSGGRQVKTLELNVNVHETFRKTLDNSLVTNLPCFTRMAPYRCKYCILSPIYGLVFLPTTPWLSVVALPDFEKINAITSIIR